jgi:hypothetical protein
MPPGKWKVVWMIGSLLGRSQPEIIVQSLWYCWRILGTFFIAEASADPDMYF